MAKIGKRVSSIPEYQRRMIEHLENTENRSMFSDVNRYDRRGILNGRLFANPAPVQPEVEGQLSLFDNDELMRAGRKKAVEAMNIDAIDLNEPTEERRQMGIAAGRQTLEDSQLPTEAFQALGGPIVIHPKNSNGVFSNKTGIIHSSKESLLHELAHRADATFRKSRDRKQTDLKAGYQRANPVSEAIADGFRDRYTSTEGKRGYLGALIDAKYQDYSQKGTVSRVIARAQATKKLRQGPTGDWSSSDWTAYKGVRATFARTGNLNVPTDRNELMFQAHLNPPTTHWDNDDVKNAAKGAGTYLRGRNAGTQLSLLGSEHEYTVYDVPERLRSGKTDQELTNIEKETK